MDNKHFCPHNCLNTFGFRIGTNREQKLASVRSKPGGVKEKKTTKY